MASVGHAKAAGFVSQLAPFSNRGAGQSHLASSSLLFPLLIRERSCGCPLQISLTSRKPSFSIFQQVSYNFDARDRNHRRPAPAPSPGFNRSKQRTQVSRGRRRVTAAAGSSDTSPPSTQSSDSPSHPQPFGDSSAAAIPRSVPWPDPSRPRICIVGGGFGGLYTALRLDSLTWPGDKRPQIMLVDQSERFVFKPMLYELLNREADPWEIAPPFRELLSRTNVRFLKGKVKSVAPYDREGEVMPAVGPGGVVRLVSGEEIAYDWLVLALGAEMKMSFVPGAKENALPFSTLEDAQRVDKQLSRLEADLRKQRSQRQAPQPLRISIIGGGYTGVELASTVAERFGSQARVQIIEPSETIVASGVQGNREAAKKVLQDRNVELALGYRVTTIREAPGRTAESTRAYLEVEHVASGVGKPTEMEADLVLWTVGTKAVAPEGDASHQPFPLNSRGQTETDETLRVKGHPRVFALGDAAGVASKQGVTLAPTAQVAFQAADYVGWNIWAAINGRPLLPFRYQHLGEMMTLGAKDGTVTLNLPGGLTLEGPLGSIARKIAYAYRMPTTEHKIRVGLSWATRAAFETASSILPSLATMFR
ncbi:NADH-dehydrogenase [Klebsormidium nitens]|uniref:demethylphylloquinone reductase n=1 Tax=Klebsormidium nitens TaxID=105231 RepID=A0A1Y1HRG8_KLENI|nr:NADH-dehydrogenase [Klebsormidium nitens]|eukprot:GAQ79157.1 NADH-dehydrogenase [Klebsormidium nitens]